MLPLAVARSLRRSRAAPLVAARARTLASVADNLDLNLPAKFGHFINGEFVEPADGQYFDNLSPIDGQNFIQAARGTKADVDKAVDAANAAFTDVTTPS